MCLINGSNTNRPRRWQYIYLWQIKSGESFHLFLQKLASLSCFTTLLPSPVEHTFLGRTYFWYRQYLKDKMAILVVKVFYLALALVRGMWWIDVIFISSHEQNHGHCICSFLIDLSMSLLVVFGITHIRCIRSITYVLNCFS